MRKVIIVFIRRQSVTEYIDLFDTLSNTKNETCCNQVLIDSTIVQLKISLSQTE